MRYNVPEEEKPAFNKQTQKGLVLLTQGISDTLGRVKSLQPQTLVDAYNQPVQAPVTRNLTPLEQYVYEPQPVPEVGSLTEMPARESMVVPQEQPQVLSNFRNQAEAQFSRDMVSITPYEQAVTDVIGAEVDSLRNDSGEIASSPLEVFSKPLDANKVKALGFVDAEGNPTETGELFFNLKNSGMFNEDGTITEKGQAYLIPRSELKKPENNRAFKVWYDDQLDETPAADGEIMGAVFGFGKNLFTGAFNLLQTANKLTSVSGLYNIAKQTAAGKETIAELKTDQIAALEQVAKNFQNVGGYADIIQGLTGRLLYEGASAATGVPMEQMKAAAEENLYLARQRQWAANENLRDLEVGTIAEAMTGIDGIVNMAREARDTLGEEKFKQRYTGTSAVVEMSGDPANLMPAAKAFNVATSAPIASRAIIKAQQILGKTAQIEKALNEAQTIVEAGNTILKKEAVAVPLAQKLFTDISARAGANPELLARAQQASDAAKRIVSSADEVRAAMPGAMASVEQLAAKRASLATRIPEEYAKKVVQTAELGAKVRAMPANVASSILERTGNTLTKVDDAVTGYLSERGLDQAYNAALGASGVVGLAGNPVVGAIGLGAAALKTGKFLTEYGKTLRYVGKEMANARGQIPFWKRVHAHTAPGSLGKGLSHTFNIFELGGATSDILRRTGRGIVAAYPSDLFFEYLSDGGEMRPQTMTRAAAESFVLGGSFAAGGGAFMGTQQRMRELAIGDEINFRQGLVDTDQKARFEALPPVIKRSMATYSMANPTLNYNFIESGSSGYDPSSNTANININSTNPLKALVAHETLHHTIIKNNMEGGIAAMFLGDTKTNSAGGLFRSKDGKLDPEFEAFTNGYYDRLRAGGMSDAEIKTEYPLDKVAVEYFIEQHSEQYAQMAESGELGALAAKGLVRQKLSSALETILPKIPVLRDLHLKSGGAIDANGAFVTGVGILGDFGVSQNPIAKKMFREMNRRSTGMMPGQFEPLMGDKEGSGAPLFFDPTNEIDMELMHPLIQMDANDKPILKDGRPIAIAKEVDLNRTIAGLTIAEAYRKLRDNNYAPEKGEAYIDDDGTLQPGWISDNVLTQMFAKHQFNNEQKRMIRQTNKMVKEGTGQRMVMINFPATTRNKAGKVVYKTQGATIRDTVPVAITIGKDGQVLYGLMSVTKLQENIKKRAQSRRGKKLYSGNIDLILRDVQAMMDFHKKGEDSINWFTEKYGVVEADQRKKFINTMFGLLNKKEQAVLNPMLLEDGVKSSDNVYRTYRADRVSKAIPMSPEEYAAMPFSYEAVSAVRMPEQRQMPEVSPEESKNWFKQNRSNFIHVNIRGNEIDPTRDFTGWVLPVGRDAVPDANVMNTRYGNVGKQVVLVPKQFVTNSKYNPDKIKPGFRPSPEQIGTITEESINKNGTIDWSKVFAKPTEPTPAPSQRFMPEKEIPVAKTTSESLEESDNKELKSTGVDVPESVDDQSVISSAIKVANSQPWRKGRDFKLDLQRRVLEAAKQAGVNISERTLESIEYLARVGFKDALIALEQNPNAIGWYDEKTKQALGVMSLLFPEIATDENSRFAFTWALAVTSNGLKVDKNFELAERVYRQYRKTGKMPTDIKAGQAQEAINDGLGLFNKLTKEWGVDNTRKFMQTDFTVGEISRLSKDLSPGGEFSDTSVRGSAILGPKIGNGFFSNLYGLFDALTMDRWLVRTWGRWTGTLVELNPELTKQATDRLQEAVKNLTPEDKARMDEMIKNDISKMDINDLSVAIQKASMKPSLRDMMNNTPTGEEFRKSGNGLAKYLDGQKEAPANPAERNFIREIFGLMLDELRADPRYKDLTMADLQAVLWYAEKRLYETAKVNTDQKDLDSSDADGYEDDEAPDYANAAVGVAKKQGISEKRINQILEKVKNERATTTQLETQEGGQDQLRQQEGAGGFAGREKQKFKQYVAVTTTRRNRTGNEKALWSYQTKSGVDSGDAGVLKPKAKKNLGVKYISEWKPGRKLATIFRNNNLPTVKFLELDPKDAASAQKFADTIQQSKDESPHGAAVYVYPADEYQGMKLFLSDSGKSGFAVKPDGDIVSVFSMEKGSGRSIMEAAISAGGKKLDAFDTILPEFYGTHGFVEASRMPWNDEFAPDGWDKQTFKEFNNGEPDVVMMVLDPNFEGEYTPRKDIYTTDYDQAVEMQDAMLKKVGRKKPVSKTSQPAPQKTTKKSQAKGDSSAIANAAKLK